MKYFRKSALATAVVGALVSSNAGAVNLSSDGVGEVAIAPYYTVRNGWSSLINLTNTSPYPVVVKVRFHEAYNSRDIQDILVALSTGDVFSAIVKLDSNGNVVMDQTDPDTCTMPNQTRFDFNANGDLAYTGGENDGGPQGKERLQEGYIEFINMGFAIDDGTDVANSTDPLNHVGAAIERHECDIVNTAFTKTQSVTVDDPNNPGTPQTIPAILNTARQFGEPLNDLKYNYRLVNPDSGLEIGGEAVTWANFFNPAGGSGGLPAVPGGSVVPADNAACTIDRGANRNQGGAVWQATDGAGNLSCMNLITAQQEFDFLEPTLNDAFPPVSNFFSDALNAPVTATGNQVDAYRTTLAGNARGVDAVSQTIQRQFVVNEWADNQAIETVTNWVVTFPTKLFYVDQRAQKQAAMILDGPATSEAMRPEANYSAAGPVTIAAAYPPFIEPFDESSAGAQDGTSCIAVSLQRFDREETSELGTKGGTIPSPAPPQAQRELCYEANVVTINGADIFGSQVGTNVDIGGAIAGQPNGWMRLNLAESREAQSSGVADVPLFDTLGGALAPVDGGLNGFSGEPVVGWLIKTRKFANATLNFASSMDHGYITDPAPGVEPNP